MTPSKLLLALPAILCLASCQTTTTEVWRQSPGPNDGLLDTFVAAEANRGFVAPKYEVEENPLTKDGKQAQIFLTSKFIDLATKHFEKHDVMGDVGFQMKIRRLAQSKGADLMSAPSVVTRPGQRAKIEVVREMKLKGNAFDEQQNLGVTLDILPEVLTNGRIHLSGKAIIREVDSPEPQFSGGNTAIAVQSSETYFDVVLKPGQTAQLICRDAGGTGQRIAFVTAQVISPSGHPAKIGR